MKHRRSTHTAAGLVAAILAPYQPLRQACEDHAINFRAALDELCARCDRKSAGPLVLLKDLCDEIRAGTWPSSASSATSC